MTVSARARADPSAVSKRLSSLVRPPALATRMRVDAAQRIIIVRNRNILYVYVYVHIYIYIYIIGK